MFNIFSIGSISFCNFNTRNLSKVPKNAKIQTHVSGWVSTLQQTHFTEAKANKFGMRLL